MMANYYTGERRHTFSVTVTATASTYCISDPDWFDYVDIKEDLNLAVAKGLATREIWIAQWRKARDQEPPKQQPMSMTIRRAPARKCIKDARRWKRRRFLQELMA